MSQGNCIKLALVSLAVLQQAHLCRCTSEHGGCSPAPPSTLSNGVPSILTSGNDLTKLFRPVIGKNSTDPWAVFSETQVRRHGLWCQVQESNTNNMTDNNIGDWYYPTPSGLLALDNISNDGTPYQELKCSNQVGLVVGGNITNNQGIVKCITTITGLDSLFGVSIDANYFAVYEESVITTIRNCELIFIIVLICFAINYTAGPVIESNMTLTLLHGRNITVGPNVSFSLSFNVSLGLPSCITCTRDNTTIHSGRGFVSGLNYEVVRPLYVSALQPEITRVSFEETQPRVGATYSCTVYVEGRVSITSGVYNFDQLGSATSNATVTGE